MSAVERVNSAIWNNHRTAVLNDETNGEQNNMMFRGNAGLRQCTWSEYFRSFTDNRVELKEVKGHGWMIADEFAFNDWYPDHNETKTYVRVMLNGGLNNVNETTMDVRNLQAMLTEENYKQIDVVMTRLIRAKNLKTVGEGPPHQYLPDDAKLTLGEHGRKTERISLDSLTCSEYQIRHILSQHTTKIDKIARWYYDIGQPARTAILYGIALVLLCFGLSSVAYTIWQYTAQETCVAKAGTDCGALFKPENGLYGVLASFVSGCMYRWLKNSWVNALAIAASESADETTRQYMYVTGGNQLLSNKLKLNSDISAKVRNELTIRHDTYSTLLMNFYHTTLLPYRTQLKLNKQVRMKRNPFDIMIGNSRHKNDNLGQLEINAERAEVLLGESIETLLGQLYRRRIKNPAVIREKNTTDELFRAAGYVANRRIHDVNDGRQRLGFMDFDRNLIRTSTLDIQSLHRTEPVFYTALTL